ncbi:MAG TPA: secretin N-terminal domain-containing protein, partial [Vicinamibacteria bacterium]|nr:secretin N-terminal domain-containing protein [Vicinamibacteria bacterium]
MRRAFPLLTLLALLGCATSGAFRAGERAERRQDYNRAVIEYSKAVKLDPENPQYRKSLERARLRAAQEHTFAARRLSGRGLLKEALDEYRLALDLDPASSIVAAEMQATEARRAGARVVSLDEIKERVREKALPGLALGPGAREPLGLSFRNASLREAYQALGKAAGVNFIFDPQFQDQPITLDLKDVPFEQALAALGSTGHTFHRVVDAHIVTVVPDTPAKRREFEQQTVKTLFLSNADLKETIDMLRVVLGARRVAPLPGVNALTINDTPDKVAAAERIVEVVDKRRAEVMVEVEILEVNRTKLKEYGIQISSGLEAQGIEGVAGGIFPDPTRKTTLNQDLYAKSSLVVTALPGVIYRLLQQDSSTRILANPQLRTSEGQTAQARFGDQVPVPVTTFSAIAQGGLPQQPITSFEYKNVGVNIDITPRVHHDGEVTLNLKLDVSAVGPPGYQGLPTFNSRTVTTVIRLRDGETNILAGLINDQERLSLTGIPGLASIPVLGRIFSHNKREVLETDIVMTLTPHVVRRPQITEEDLRSFQVGGESAPLLFDVPGVPPVVPSP